MSAEQLFWLALIGLIITPAVTITLRVLDSRERKAVAEAAAKAAAKADRAARLAAKAAKIAALASAQTRAAVVSVGEKADAAYRSSEALVELGNHHNTKLTNVLEEVKTLQQAVIQGQGDTHGTTHP